jgi:hypothetical protein
MDEYQEANKEKGGKKAHTQGGNIQGMNGWMNTKKQIKKMEKPHTLKVKTSKDENY